MCFIGRQYDMIGNFNHWWTNSSLQQFNEKAQCIIDQYSAFEFNGDHVSNCYRVFQVMFMHMHVFFFLEFSLNCEHHLLEQNIYCLGTLQYFVLRHQINGKMTLGENMADNSGIKASLEVGHHCTSSLEVCHHCTSSLEVCHHCTSSLRR